MIKYDALTCEITQINDDYSEMPVVKDLEIAELKNELARTDYRIIKCIEYYLAQQELPYDITTLHKERQRLRNRINDLEVME